MKKRFLLLAGCVFVQGLWSQAITDALRYSQRELNGTARYQSMSGAFVSLGGDLSAMSENPAGSAVFTYNEIGFTLRDRWGTNNTMYRGNSLSYEGSDLSLGHWGMVFVFKDSDGSKWSFGYNAQQERLFEDDRLFVSGRNNVSIVDYFGAYAQDFSSDDLKLRQGEGYTDAYRDIGEKGGFDMQQAFLGYQGKLITPTQEGYRANASMYEEGVLHKFVFHQEGRLLKQTLNIGAQFDKKINLGLNFNFYNLNYQNYKNIKETDYDVNSPTQSVNFFDGLKVRQEGAFSIQLGVIVTPSEHWRFGASYHSPIWFSLAEEERQSLRTTVNDTLYDISPNVINEYRYKFRTASEYRFGGAYLFGKKGLISLDYGLKDYAGMRFSSEDPEVYDDLNEEIKNTLGYAQTLRLGGEYRATSKLSLRGGYRFEQSPYKDKNYMGNLQGWSLGIGYNLGGISFDASYSGNSQRYSYQMYGHGLTTPVSVTALQHNFLLTALIRL